MKIPISLRTREGPRKHVFCVSAHWRHLVNTNNRPYAVAMRSFVKLLSPLVLFKATSQYYIDKSYCYRRSSVVCRSACRSFTIVCPTKTAEPIEMPLGKWTRIGQGNHVLDAGTKATREWAILRAKKVRPGHDRRLIYPKRLYRGQHRYGTDADWGVVVLDGRCILAQPGEYDAPSVCDGHLLFM